MKDKICRLVALVAPWIKLNVVFVPAYKLLKLCKLKCKHPLLSPSGVVYRVDCSCCNEFYDGMTTRRLEQRLHEHCTLDHSALKRHSVDTRHVIDYACTKALATDKGSFKIVCQGVVMVGQLSAHFSLNGNTGSNELKLW